MPRPAGKIIGTGEASTISPRPGDAGGMVADCYRERLRLWRYSLVILVIALLFVVVIVIVLLSIHLPLPVFANDVFDVTIIRVH
jgi:hypothetical protein